MAASFEQRCTPCPKCGADLGLHGEVTCTDWVPAAADPEGQARADLILECEECGSQFNAFVALEDFHQIEEAD